MHLITPKGLHYPITVTKLRCQLKDPVKQHAPIFDYEYKSTVLEGSEENREGVPVERTFQSTFESYLEGSLSQWCLAVGTTLTRAGARVADVEEACDHAVQFAQMCANCGKDMTEVDYNTVETDTNRATVNTVHGHTSLLISEAEANKSDQEAKRRLLSARKLSLVVDLDMTVIQATVDSTIGEWQSDPDNPNHHALTDVRSFNLRGDFYTYYIKPRPGLQTFLDSMARHYEMHVYTAATRDYAEEIAKIIDPDGKYFADRILSRDESGNKSYKSLKRLFPVDTNMVVIIDDRGDVWQWSPNLVRVKPFDFFVGVGDINSAFLPKEGAVEYSSPPAAPTSPTPSASTSDAKPPPDSEYSPIASSKVGTNLPGLSDGDNLAETEVSVIDRLIAEDQRNDSGSIEEQSHQTVERLAAQAAEKPMLQQQKLIDDADNNQVAEAEAATTTPDEISGNGSTSESHNLQHTRSAPRHSLLHNDDDELVYLQQGLRKIHNAWYDRYEVASANVRGSRVAELRPGQAERPMRNGLGRIPDVARVMRDIKEQVLNGLELVITGVVPTFCPNRDNWVYQLATSYGAMVKDEITPTTTHVIAHPQRKTIKVRKAARHRDRVKIVSLGWLEASANQLRPVDETPYLLHQQLAPQSPSPTPPSSAPVSSPVRVTNSGEANDEANSGKSDGSETDDEDLEAYMPVLSREDTREPEDNWASMENELNDFLGSDAESESETESVVSRGTGEGGSTTLDERKRKHDEMTHPLMDGDESDVSVPGGDSKLQGRKRKALARVSSLSSAVTTPVEGTSMHCFGTSDLDSIDEKINGKSASLPQAGSDAVDDVDEDDLEAELEAEMLRQEEVDDDASSTAH